ncbi:FAD:protein FMN transferase [Asticcacaulis sp. AND118]|uniref:FAD:protein FMN transferase n=1 Tax=Asticcacaulis sp. AND118 TaxID=2840468 RepID=UPI001CFFA6DC|nr:FAD:protein FMN transferase [Asticcacaulis sp. AND118]UDF05112.1 FAD:protein FMN transferase [Asticcacaulis sp. AND118]
MLNSPSTDRRVLVPALTQAPEDVSACLPCEVSGKAFATTWQVRLHTDGPIDRQGLSARIQALLDRIDAEMSPYRADSDLTRFNEAPTGAFVALPPLLMQVIAHALDIARLSDGAFDPALLEAVELWGFGAKIVAEGLPAPQAQAALKQRQDWRALNWQSDGLTKPEGVKLDLCGIAKGYAVDMVTQMLKETPGVRSALVEIGGELKGFGIHRDGQPWWVEIESAPTGLETLVALLDMAVATSGDTKRFFIHDGVRLSHTIDAATAAPVRSGISQVSVFDADCWRADALATALMVMGEARAMQFAQTHAIPCLIRLSDGREMLSPVLEDWL